MTEEQPAGTQGNTLARQRLLESALRLFTIKGYATTTVREIVAAAGVSKPVLYYYFGSKEGIYLELMQEPLGRFEAMLLEMFQETGGARERIVTLLDRIFQLVLTEVGVTRLMYAMYFGPPQGAPYFDFEAYHEKIVENVRFLVAQGIADGEFRPGNPDDMAWALVGVFTVAMEEQLCDRPPRLDRQGLLRILDLIMAGFVPQQDKEMERC